MDKTLIDKCPTCGKPPSIWQERPKYGSRELFWVGCQADELLQGGLTVSAAVQSWNRHAAILKFTGAK